MDGKSHFENVMKLAVWNHYDNSRSSCIRRCGIDDFRRIVMRVRIEALLFRLHFTILCEFSASFAVISCQQLNLALYGHPNNIELSLSVCGLNISSRYPDGEGISPGFAERRIERANNSIWQRFQHYVCIRWEFIFHLLASDRPLEASFGYFPDWAKLIDRMGSCRDSQKAAAFMNFEKINYDSSLKSRMNRLMVKNSIAFARFLSHGKISRLQEFLSIFTYPRAFNFKVWAKF
jgi:hypothetical protein